LTWKVLSALEVFLRECAI